MKIKTSELIGPPLNWAVAMAEGDRVFRPRVGRPDDWDREAWETDGSDDRYVVRVQNPNVARFVDWTYNPSGSWREGGPIIERERIDVYVFDRDSWGAEDNFRARQYGPTPLVAAMRCYVASKLGEEADIPEKLT